MKNKSKSIKFKERANQSEYSAILFLNDVLFP